VRVPASGKGWPEIGVAKQHDTQIPRHNLRMRLRAKLTNPYLVSHRVLVEVVQSNGVYPPRWMSCASTGFCGAADKR
jgi:hypothetical protein